MLKYSLKISIVFVPIILFSACKKYPDGPKFSLSTVKHRMKGTYKLEQFIVDGNDSINYLVPCTVLQKVPLAKEDGSYYFKFEGGDIKGLDGNGNYFYEDKHKSGLAIGYTLGVGSSPSPPDRNIFHPIYNSTENGIWEIRRLTNKEFWLRNDIGNSTYELHLKKIK